jgi:hypothetical protein
MAQVVEQLPSKGKGPESKPTNKNINKEMREEGGVFSGEGGWEMPAFEVPFELRSEE